MKKIKIQEDLAQKPTFNSMSVSGPTAELETGLSA